MNKKVLIFGGFVVAAAVGFYLYTKSNKSSEGELKQGSGDIPIIIEIRTDLKWVANKNTAAYLATILPKGKGTSLRSWVDRIKKERAADSSKWKDSSGLSGETSDIGHALYQMKYWNADVAFGLQDNQ